MPPSEPSHDSDDDEFDLDIDDEGAQNSEPGEFEPESSMVGIEDADDDSNTDDSDSDDDDDDDEGEGEDNDEDDDDDREQQELAMDIDAELRELEASAAELPSVNAGDHEPIAENQGDDDVNAQKQMGHHSPGLVEEGSPQLDIPLLAADDEQESLMPVSPTQEPSSPPSVSMASPPRRSPSPATRRHYELFAPIGNSISTSSIALNGTALPPNPYSSSPARTPRSYSVEAICALPHPVPTHALASSHCMTHFLTGSDDGYIRNYDIFSAVNGKTFLTQPQRQHAGVVEGLFKSGQIRCWWENPVLAESQRRAMLFSNPGVTFGNSIISHSPEDQDGLAPVYSMIMHSDALWALAGSDSGHINLFTVRHEPGKLVHVMDKHRGPVSAMAMDYDEKGFFSAGWDGEALQWDLNTGKNVRNFAAHGAQLAAIAIRPAHSGPYVDPSASGGVVYRRKDRDKIKDRQQKDYGQEYGGEEDLIPMVKVEPTAMNFPTPGGHDVFMADASSGSNEIPSQVEDFSKPSPFIQPDPPQGAASHETEPAPVEADANGDDKSDGSFDPLFDEEGDEGNSNNGQAQSSTTQPPAATGANPYSTANLTGQNPPTDPSSTNANPLVPGVPQSHLVTFPLGLSGPSVPVPLGGQQRPVQSYFHTITPPQSQNSNPPSQSGQQFQFQLVKPSGPGNSTKPVTKMATHASTLSTSGTGIAPPKNAPPLLDSASYQSYSGDLLMTAFIDGQVVLWDRRVSTPGRGVGRLWMSEKTPPWCLSACWSLDGGQIYAGRRNGTIDVWDVRLMGRSGPSNIPRLLKTIRNPPSSGVVSCVVPFPDCRHIACASVDNIRLWNVAEAGGEDSSMSRSSTRGGVLFKIIPGHHGGYISQMLIDPGARFMITASSNRGWHGDSTKTVFVHDIKQVF